MCTRSRSRSRSGRVASAPKYVKHVFPKNEADALSPGELGERGNSLRHQDGRRMTLWDWHFVPLTSFIGVKPLPPPLASHTPHPSKTPAYEALTFFLGCVILLPFGPFVAWDIFWCTAWEFVDKKTLGLIQMCAKLSDYVSPRLSALTRHPKDGFVVLLLVYLGVLYPALFFYEMRRAVDVGFSVWRCAALNIFRIGPMFANFMWVYVMCHKEGHAINGR